MVGIVLVIYTDIGKCSMNCKTLHKCQVSFSDPSIGSELTPDTAGPVQRRHTEPSPASVQLQEQHLGQMHSPQERATQQICKFTNALYFRGTGWGMCITGTEVEGVAFGMFFSCTE